MLEGRRIVGVCAAGVSAAIVGCTSLLGDFAVGEDASRAEGNEAGVGAEADQTNPDDGTGPDATVTMAESGSTSDTARPDGTVTMPESGSTSDGTVSDDSPVSEGATGDAPGDAQGDGPGGCLTGQLVCAAGCVSPSDVHTCGSCSNDCTQLPHVASSGVQCLTVGTCAYSCLAGYAHCSTNPADGCETDLSTPSHCGSCTNTCGANMVCALTGGAYACTTTCPMGTMLCNGSCANLSSDNSNCGTCGHACSGGMTCQGGTCACTSPQTVCNGICYSTQSDPLHCGANCTACPVPPANGTATCNGGSCGTTCNAGYSDCGGGTPCAYDTNTDSTHCGANCAACAANNTCSGGACVCGPAPYQLCGSVCVNTSNNATACGASCTDCTVNDQKCQSGACVNCTKYCGSPPKTCVGCTSICCGTGGACCPSGSACSGGFCL